MNGLVETSMLVNATVDEGEDGQEGGGTGDEFIDVDEAIHSWRLRPAREPIRVIIEDYHRLIFDIYNCIKVTVTPLFHRL